ncbi:hypothetical protein JTB14_027985 [Gonioctena quinquepunctata]|nr:hypothetical protein JTB14_027985 [Gonioctena quinquepunctata]
MDLEKIRIQQWINDIPSVHTFADKSISLSSRSGKAESFEVVKEVPKVEGMYFVKMPKLNPEKNEGEDNIDSIIATEVIEGKKHEPMISKTKLGWVIHWNTSSIRG